MFGCSAADYDSDGDLDLYVLNYEKNVLFRNNGDGTFTDVSAKSGLDNPLWSLCAPWFDYDDDGDLDVLRRQLPQVRPGEVSRVLRGGRLSGSAQLRRGARTRCIATTATGRSQTSRRKRAIVDPDGRGMSATVTDLDNDGLLDIYVANDATENFYFRNLGDGRFENEAVLRGLAFGEGGQGVSSMGPTVGDVDRDGWMDVYIPDMGYGCLLMNTEGVFDDRTARSKLARHLRPIHGLGRRLVRRGQRPATLDLFVANGNAHFEYPEEDVLAINDGQGELHRCRDQFGRLLPPEVRGTRRARTATTTTTATSTCWW